MKRTGPGLAIVKHIMQQAGGSVAVKSDLGKGSSFTLTFRAHAGKPGVARPREGEV